MNTFLVVAGEVLSSPVMIFFASLLASISGLLALFKLARSVKWPSTWVIFLISCVNACIALAAEYLASAPLPPLIMLAIPAVIILEVSIISRDTWWAYLNFFFAILMDLGCIYGLSNAFVSIFMEGFWPLGGNEHRYTLFSLTMLGATLTFQGATHSAVYSVHELSELMHSRSRGMLLFIYYVISSVTLMLSSFFTLGLVYDDSLSRQFQIMIHADLVVKNVLILACRSLIVVIQIKQDRSLQRSHELDIDLKKERSYRESTQKKGMISYCANVTKNLVEEGREVFSSDLCAEEEGYVEMMKQFALKCVHQKDWRKFFVIGNPTYFKDRLESSPSYKLRFRINPARMLEVTNVPHTVREKLLSENKEWIWVEIHCTITRDVVTNDILSYISVVNIDDEVAKEDALQRAANVDALTGVFNRAALEDYVREYLARGETSGVMFLIDLDHFKLVNDSLGHPEGDRVLKETADMLRAVFRHGDVIGRIGGDEFCVFAPQMTQSDVIVQRAKELNEQGLRIHMGKNGEQVQTSLSIGMASILDCGSDYEDLYASADIALYRAKQLGRNTYCMYTAEMVMEAR